MKTIDANTLRKMAVAGQFYPQNADELSDYVRTTLANCPKPLSPPLAVISPHAGYAYSGALTGQALATSAQRTDGYAVILSPSHRHRFSGLAVPSAGAFALPDGSMPVDVAACAALVEAGLAHVEDAAHDREHGIEVQLPFLHQLHALRGFVPLVIGEASDTDVAAAVDFLTHFRATPPLFVLSSDLSHFLSHEAAQAKDALSAKLIETGQTEALRPEHACGHRAISGFFKSRFGQGRRVSRLGMASSFAVNRDPNRTVGYGAWSVYAGEAEIIPPPQRQALLRVARQALTIRLTQGKAPNINLPSFAPVLQTHAATFVTLTQNGRLRGCIGSLAAHAPLVTDVAMNAIKAGLQDPRFKPLAAQELPKTDIKIAILSPARPMQFTSQADLEAQLEPGRDGLIIRDGNKRGIFLPMVWEQLTTPEAFLNGLKVKAGLPKTHWSDSVEVERFVTESFADPRPTAS